jgi:hypothetical protein
MTSGLFVLMVALGVFMTSRRNSLVMYVPFLIVNLVVLARAVIAYRRARKRSGAAPWEESTLHS